MQHLRDGWEVSGLLRQHFIIPVPAQMRTPGENWYRGTADAIYQNINLIEQADPHYVVIFGADHIYRMNIRRDAGVSRAQARAGDRRGHSRGPRSCAAEFGVIETDGDGPHHGLSRKDARTRPPCPAIPTRVYASMGNYIFSTSALLRELYADAQNEESSHDFGRDILPRHGRTRRHVRLRFPDQPHSGRSARRRRPIGATSEPSTPTTTPAWTCARRRRR